MVETAHNLSLDDPAEALHPRASDGEESFRLIAESAPAMLWMGDETGQCLYLNKALREFWGVASVETFDWTKTVHPEDMAHCFTAMGAAMEARRPVTLEARYVRAADGAYRILETRAEPRFSTAGEFLGMIGVNADITDRRQAEEQRTLLINELNHRVKNTLATVQSLVMQTIRHAASPDDVQELLEARLFALSRAHDVLTQQNWQSAEVSDLIERALAAFRTPAERIFTTGPPARLSPKQALALSMALHELATNAAKYGALSVETGRIDIGWSVKEDSAARLLALRWIESGGPLVKPPTRRGFGARLIERNLGAELGSDATLTFRPEGLIADFRAPLSAGVDS